MVRLMVGSSQEESDEEKAPEDVMHSSVHSSCDSGSNAEMSPLCALAASSARRQFRPPFRTQLSEPNYHWQHSSGSSSAPFRPHNSIASPESPSPFQADAQLPPFAPEHFRHEPFSVFYGNATSVLGTSATAAIVGCPQSAANGSFSSGDERNAAAAVQQQAVVPRSLPFILPPEACALLARLFQHSEKVLPTELRRQLIAHMLSLQTVRFDKNRRSSLAPPQADSFLSPSSGAAGGHYSPDSLFFHIAPSSASRKNSFAGPSPSMSSSALCFFAAAADKGADGGEQLKGAQQKQRRKRAVITVDAQSTQILIASDSVCRLFGLRDRSLVGKRLDEVFPVAPSGAPLPEGTKGPLLLRNAFFADDKRQRLRPVYGQPVDILDAEGRRLALSVWFYPLAPTGAHGAAPRKNSAILMRSPSAFLASASGSPFFFQASSGATRASQSVEQSTTKVTPPTLLALNSTHHPQQRSSSSHQGGDSHHSIPTSQRSNKSQSPCCCCSSTQSAAAVATGSCTPLEEVAEEEQQQQNCSSARSECYSLEGKDAEAAKCTEHPAKQQTPHTANSFVPPLNAPDPCVGITSAQSTAAKQQQCLDRGRGTTTNCCRAADRKGGAKAPTQAMVQAGVHQRSQEPAEEHQDAVVVIPIGGALPEGADAEPRRKGLLRRQYQCEILPNTSAGKQPNNNINNNSHHNGSCAPPMAIGEQRKGPPTTTMNGNCGGQKQQMGAQMNAQVAGNQAPQQPQERDAAKDQQNGNNRWLILMEPINALFASVILGAKGRIFRVDDAFAAALGYECTNRLFGTEIQRLIPSLRIGIDWEAEEQLCCGSTVRHNGVPFSVTVSSERDQESDSVFSFEVRIRSLASINGVVTLMETGAMYSYNENFFHELLGMQFDEQHLHSGESAQRIPVNFHRSKMDITDVIPHFFEYMEVAHFHINQHLGEHQTNGIDHKEHSTEAFLPTVSHSSSCLFTQELATARRALGRRSNSFYGEVVPEDEANGAEATHSGERPEIIPGIFYGLAKHSDGMLIPVKIEVSNVETHQQQQQPRLFAIYIGFDRSADYGISQLSEQEEKEEEKEQAAATQASQQLHSSAASNGLAIGAAVADASGIPTLVRSTGAKNCLVPGTAVLHDAVTLNGRAARFSIGGTGFLRECESDSVVNFVVEHRSGGEELVHSTEVKMQEVSLDKLEDENNEAVRGEYSKYYDTFQLIGNGAFGSVKLAARKDIGLLAVSKFICKAKVLPESWVQSPKRGNRMVPIEVHLLENLNHPNIVRVLDVFENDNYYQLVMEKCGCGMDLFEFIDHQPKLDEPLISYIFGQIVSAVDYLHQNQIVHRDLKDENVIIDQSFNCKLIDFGSAAFFGDGIVFSTFCGTMEYCSPEVLTGNKYLGPELEMWSMGILLYTLVFFENPFRSAQETVQAEIDLPWDISEGLYQVLSWLLQPDPSLRATVAEIKRHWWLTQRVDPRRYIFKELLRNCERAQVMPPLYVSDLQNHLKRTGSASCSNLAGVSITSAINAEAAAGGNQDGPSAQPQQQQQIGVVSAR